MNFFASNPEFLRAQFQRQLTTGAVIKLSEKMDDGKVQEKRFVVAMVTDKTFCCVINSKVNTFLQSRPALLKCQVLMPHVDHPFMSWDSYVDCASTKAYSSVHVLDEFMKKTGSLLGRVTSALRDNMVSALKFSPALSVKEVTALCIALQAME